jgi:hypothetical protein
LRSGPDPGKKLSGEVEVLATSLLDDNDFKYSEFQYLYSLRWGNEEDKILLGEKLSKLFVMNPIVVRKDREVPRKKTSNTQSFNFQKRVKKHVF